MSGQGGGPGREQDRDTENEGGTPELEGVSGLPFTHQLGPGLAAMAKGTHGGRTDRSLPIKGPSGRGDKEVQSDSRGSSEGAPQHGPRAVPRRGQRQAWGGRPAPESSRQRQDWPRDGLWRDSIPSRADATHRGPGGEAWPEEDPAWLECGARQRGRSGQLQPDLQTRAGPRSSREPHVAC